jgi:hypothetical protein
MLSVRARPFQSLVGALTLGLLSSVQPAIAQEILLEGAQRIVGEFNFEERAFNVEPVPQHWVRLVNAPPLRERPGFPPWNESRFDQTVARSGEHSVLIPVSGGSAALRVSGGVLAAIPGADYLVSAYVRTDGLTHARARLTARMLNDHLQPLEDSEASSELVDSPADWARVQVRIYGDHPDAAWIQIDLELLQPDQQPDRHVAARELVLEDLNGRAWFDDVSVVQLPRVQLETNSPINVIEAPKQPEIIARVRDLTGERLEIDLHVFDIDGRLEAVRTFDADPRGTAIRWSPEIEGYGWRRVTLRVLSDGREVAFDELPFVWAAPRAGPAPLGADQFGVVLSPDAGASLHAVPLFMDALGARAAHLPLWPDPLADETFDDRIKLLEPALGALLNMGTETTLILDGAPPALASELRGDIESPLDLLDIPLERWSRYLDPALVRFGQRVKRWQPVPIGDRSFRYDEVHPARVKAFEQMLGSLSPEPVVALPWRSNRQIDPGMPEVADVTAVIPRGAAPDTIPTIIQSLRNTGFAAPDLMIEAVPDQWRAGRWRVADLVKRAVYARVGGDLTLLIDQPWRWRESSRKGPRVLPELAAWRTIVSLLSGRTVVGALPTPSGATALILDGEDGGLIVAWNDWADPDSATLHVYLGASAVTVTDVFGNASDAPASPDGSHIINLMQSPVFISGVDFRLALFQSGMRIEPGFVPSIAARHNLELVIENPWDAPVTGRVRLAEPMRWDMTPRVQRFVIPQGGTARLPFSAMLGVAEEAGVRHIEAQVELAAGAERASFTVRTPVEIGLSEVALTATARIAGDEDQDVVVTLLVTNTTDAPVTMHAFAVAHGFARQQAPVSRLAPGASTLRQFVLRGAGSVLRGQAIRVGLVDVSGPLRLNKTVLVR